MSEVQMKMKRLNISNNIGSPNKQVERIIRIDIERDVKIDLLQNNKNNELEKKLEAAKSSSDNERNKSMEKVDKVDIKPLPIICNCPEKIVLIIDRSLDENFTPFQLNPGIFVRPLGVIKNALKIFIQLKQSINSHHEFAIVVLNENSAQWLLDFTKDTKLLNKTIDEITECDAEDIFKMNNLFNVLSNNIDLIDMDKYNSRMDPEYVIRCVLIYNRSYTIPKLEPQEIVYEMLKNPFFLIDTLISHEVVEESNNCKKIFEELKSICYNPNSYFLTVGRDALKLHNAFSLLLGHPLQRNLQLLDSDFKS